MAPEEGHVAHHRGDAEVIGSALETRFVDVADEHSGTLCHAAAGTGTADPRSRGRGDQHDLALE